MPYSYPPSGLPGVGELREQIQQAGKPAKWTPAKAGTTANPGNYFGIYNAHAVPLRFDANTAVGAGMGIGVISTQVGWVGGRARIGIYNSHPTTTMPNAKVWDAGLITGIGLAGPGFYSNNSPTGSAVLNKDELYWLVTHLIAEDGAGSPAPAAEYYSNECVYNAFVNAGNEPMFSVGFASGNDVAFNLNTPPTGLYVQDIVDFGWAEATPWPATLTGTLNNGFSPTTYSVATFLSVSED